MIKIIKILGFKDLPEAFGTFYPLLPSITTISVVISSMLAFIELYSGISILFWVFFVAASLFDLGLGCYANIIFLKQPYESDKMIKGIVKSFILFVIIFITNTLKLGVETSNIVPQILKDASIYSMASIHYSFVIIIGMFILMGISENGEKIGIQACASINKILRMKIKKIENNHE